MFPIYLIILLIALGAVVVYYKTSEEIHTVLAAATAIICLICGFALAPLPLQLGIILLVLNLERLYFFKQGRPI